MSAPASLRKGWCPGALAPMQAGDGWLVRVRVTGGRLSLDRAAALADCAARFGNGVLEISSRANLQLRGIDEAGLPALQRRLDELGLLDADSAVETVRNVIASPLSDVDPEAILDAAPIVAALEARLGDDRALHALPPKFNFLVDGGGALPLGDVEADVRFEAASGESGARFAIGLGGADDVAAFCAPDEVAGVAAALATAFLRAAGIGANAPRRMRDLVAIQGAPSIFAAAALASFAWATRRRRVAPGATLGIRRFGASFCVGAAPPLGRLSADDLGVAALAARRASAVDIRLTPWRTLIVTGLDDDHAGDLAAALSRQGFILDAADRRLAIVACSGAPACANAARAVQADARQWAHAAPPGRGIVLHVSGCEKGCAHGRVAPITLISRASGYDLVLDGKACDEPARRGLSIEDIAPLLERLAGSSV
jgi:precorrin-3B synthase